MHRLVTHYFTHLFSPIEGDWQQVTSLVSARVTEDDNTMLLRPLCGEEIRRATFQMHPDKAPGPDGINLSFFQKFWNTVGPRVITSYQHGFEHMVLLEDVNDTHIVLIPKKSKPDTLKDMHPISLCNVIYNTFVKALANRLRRVLPALVAETQSTLVPERNINDNILSAFEIIHYMRYAGKRRRTEMALKVDISKAYDNVRWGYLEAMLLRLGFADKWVKRMMLYVSTISYKVLLNGKKVGPISPFRGL